MYIGVTERNEGCVPRKSFKKHEWRNESWPALLSYYLEDCDPLLPIVLSLNTHNGFDSRNGFNIAQSLHIDPYSYREVVAK